MCRKTCHGFGRKASTRLFFSTSLHVVFVFVSAPHLLPPSPRPSSSVRHTRNCTKTHSQRTQLNLHSIHTRLNSHDSTHPPQLTQLKSHTSTYTTQRTHTHTQLSQLNLHNSTYIPQLTHSEPTHLNLHNSTLEWQLTLLNLHTLNLHTSTCTTQLLRCNLHTSTDTSQLTDTHTHTELTHLNFHNSGAAFVWQPEHFDCSAETFRRVVAAKQSLSFVWRAQPLAHP